MSNQEFRTAANNLNLNQQQASDLLETTQETYQNQLENRLNQAPYDIDINDLPRSNMRAVLLDLVFNGGQGLIGNE